MTWRFNSPPGWPPAPADFAPPPGWLPDPSWPPAPPEWNFWIDDATEPTDPPQLTADDGTAVVANATLTFTFTMSQWKAPFKAAIGTRTYPLDAIDDVVFKPPGSVRNGFLSVRVKPGRDALRQFLKDDAPSVGSDPDCLTITPAQAALTELFVTRLRDAVTRSVPSGDTVSTGRLPITVKGADGTVGFDGRTLTMEFGGWTTDAAKKRLGRNMLLVSSLRGVQVRHPGMSGWIRFVTADAPTKPNLPASKDPHSLCLNADAARGYVVLAAAVARHLPAEPEPEPSTPITPEPEPVARTAPDTATPVSPTANRLPYGLPASVQLETETRLIRASGLNLVRLASLGEKIGVVGESHYQKALRKVANGRTVPPGSFDDAIAAVAVLIPERDNPHDATAVRVDLLDHHGAAHTVGHLDRYRAAQCHDPLLRLNGSLGYCQARIMGGGRGRHYGVFLHWHPGQAEPVVNRCATGYLLEGDRRVTVTKEASHQAVLSRYAPAHVDGRTVALAELAFARVRSGKYAGQATVEVRLDGDRVGETTRHQASKYEALLRAFFDTGASVVCESIVRRKVGQLEVELLLPSRF